MKLSLRVSIQGTSKLIYALFGSTSKVNATPTKLSCSLLPLHFVNAFLDGEFAWLEDFVGKFVYGMCI